MSEQSGKVGHHLIEQLIQSNSGHSRPEVSQGANFGTDVSVIDLPGNMAMALTSDPLSLIPSLGLQESAWLSVHLMANDMATTGFSPMYGQFVLNLPASFSRSDFKIYWNHIHRFCDNLKISITGGHTGFIEGQNSTIAGGGTLITVAPKNKIRLSKSARSGDAILVTKTCALSSAAILAMSFPERVKNKAGTETFHDACNSFYDTSSLPEALIAVNETDEQLNATAMHDVTEGGVLGAIYELAIASENGAIIYNNKLPIAEVQETVCNIFHLDPRYCIGAGSMIITCKKEASEKIINRLAVHNIDCAEVGELCDNARGISLIEDEQPKPLIYLENDPYWAAFFQATKEGWK